MTALQVLDPGPLTTVQDLGRPGLASLGVSPSGAADRAAAARANALAGNPPTAALLETTLGGLVLRADIPVVLGVAGAPVDVEGVVRLAAGQTLRLGRPAVGVRTYVAVRGGVDVAPVLGSRSTDLLSGLGPARLRAGDVLAVGDLPPEAAHVPPAVPCPPAVELPLLPGPRLGRLAAGGWERLLTTWTVSPDSNRVAVRLVGEALPLTGLAGLASEGLVRGAVQVPPNGAPVLFLADHPVTGGYPVVGVVPDAAVDRAAQARPGSRVTFRAAEPGPDRG